MGPRGFFHMGSKHVVANNGFYRTITIDHTLVPANQTDFPVLFTGTYAYLATTSNAGKVESASGYDIRIYSDSALTTLLDFEVVYWDDTTGEIEIWFKTNLSSTVDTVVYLAYGNPSFTTDVSNVTGVWTDYVGVYHFPNGTSLDVSDSTGVNPGTIQGTITATTGTVGIGGADFGGTFADYIDLGTDSTLNPATEMTITGWVDLNTTGGSYHTLVARWGPGGHPYILYVHPGSGDALVFDLNNDAGVATGTTPIINVGWKHVAAVYNKTDIRVYIDGVLDGTPTAYTADIATSAENTVIGVNEEAVGTTTMSGNMDELRISAIAKDANWIETEYNNQSAPASFYTIGAEI